MPTQTPTQSLTTVTGFVYSETPILQGQSTALLVDITLANVSKMDVAATRITSQLLVADALPATYSISFDAGLMDPRMTYALQARVTNKAGDLLAINDTVHQFTLKDDLAADIIVKPIKQKGIKAKRARLTCEGGQYALLFYPDFLLSRVLPSGNRLVLPKVVSASGEKYERGDSMIFLKGNKPPIVEMNGNRLNCQLSL